MTTQRPLIVVPTRHELQNIREEVAALGIHADFACCGLGPGGVARWTAASEAASRAGGALAPGRTVILAGLAGGLDPAVRPGIARSARMITSADADECGQHQKYIAPLHRGDALDIATLDRIASTVAEKRALWKATGAGLVDMESAPFAAVASARGWCWGVVRAVSDDANTPLAPWIVELIKTDGSTNYPALARAVLGDPRRIATLVTILRITRPLVRAIAEQIAHLLDSAAERTDEDHEYRTLVFGGSFDPPHRRHAEVVALAAQTLGCGRIDIVPASHAPLRDAPNSATDRDRLEMARRAFARVSGASIDSREINRGGISYTVDTLREIADERKLAHRDLVLLIGSDQALQFDRWKSWREIDEQLAAVAVIARPPETPDALRRQLREKFDALGSDGQRWADAVLDLEPIDLSSTEIRRRLSAGLGIDDLVDASVVELIRQRGLYREFSERIPG